MNLFEHLAPWVAGFLTAEKPPTRYGLANVPHFIRRPCPFAWGGLGMVSGGVVFRGLSKLLHQEDALGGPCLDTVMVALRSRRWVADARVERMGARPNRAAVVKTALACEFLISK